jgi:hypothetical protein
MKRNLLLFGIIGLSVMLWPAFLSAQCPEDPNDSGICDSMYLEVWPPDINLFDDDFLFRARVLIYVTHDVPDPAVDSIAGFVIPLCFEHTNPAASCSLDPYFNNTCLYPFPTPERGVFRHIPHLDDPQVENWMTSLSAWLMGWDWDTRILDFGDQRFWLSTFPTGSADQLFPQGSKTLLATLTFTFDDSTTICIDSCFWPPASSLTFVRSDGVAYIPRHNLPHCFSISYLTGDCNSDGTVDAADVVYLISYLYRGGPAPPLLVGDVNCNGVTEAGDVVFLINYLFRGGPEPSC